MFNKLCTPAKFYFVVSVIFYVLMLAQNINCSDRFHLGEYSCPQNTGAILFLNALYIIVWTWVINLICTSNKTISWIIVLFPIILLFICLGIVLMNGIKKENNKRENFQGGCWMGNCSGSETSQSTLGVFS